MAKLKLKAKLTGVGVVNNAYIYLENVPDIAGPEATPIGLFPEDSGKKKWSNDNITLEVIGNLDYQVNVHATKGTDWSLKLTNKDTDKEIVTITGTTGQNPDHGTNISKEKGSVVIDPVLTA